MKPGDRLPDLVRTIDLTAMVAYAAATWDWHRLHHDPEHARRAGLDRPVVDGQMLGALLAEQVMRHIGHQGRITRLRYRNRGPVYAGSVVTCEATIAEAGPRGFTIDQLIRVGDELVVAPAAAEVELTSEPGRRPGGQPAPLMARPPLTS